MPARWVFEPQTISDQSVGATIYIVFFLIIASCFDIHGSPTGIGDSWETHWNTMAFPVSPMGSPWEPVGNPRATHPREALECPWTAHGRQ